MWTHAGQRARVNYAAASSKRQAVINKRRPGLKLTKSQQKAGKRLTPTVQLRSHKTSLMRAARAVNAKPRKGAGAQGLDVSNILHHFRTHPKKFDVPKGSNLRITIKYVADLVITTKLFLGSKGYLVCGPNEQGVGRKHIVEGTKASLKRLALDYVDVVFCHRPEPFTPIEETVRAMNFVIQQGWALYWGTSQWLAADISEACEVADRLGLIRPVVEQAQYNMFVRDKVDFEYLDLYKKYKLGVTTWAPLAYGTLTGKYSSGAPAGSRFSNEAFASRPLVPSFKERVEMADKLKPIAAELGCSLPQLATAWCVANENVSTVLVGASRPEQLVENLKAIDFVSKITPEVRAKVDAIVNFVPSVPELDVLATLRGRHL
ncbi:hypothetical protein BBJ28_00008722 [Nothophytophthora sp. Chile5]|nr:hypothetical protein BBJ28_00008722 [Nothophytophthora sp. Chile5]